MINLPMGDEKADDSTINFLIGIGALYVDETGIHANETGIYSKQEKIPTQTANPSGD